MTYHRLLTRLALGIITIGIGLVYGFVIHSTHWPPYSFLQKYVGFEKTAGGKSRPFTPKPGLTSPPPLMGITKPDAQTQAPDDGQLAQLAALGYLDGYEPAGERTGVIKWDREAAQDGLNLVMSGHAAEACLMEMDGTVVHRWSYRFTDAFPNAHVPADQFHTQSWRRVHLLRDGGILAIYNGHGLIRLDKDSRLIWALSEKCHHDLDVSADESTIYTLIQDERIDPSIHASKPVLAEYIGFISSDGKLIRKIAVLDAFRGSPYEPLLTRMPPYGDILHANTLELLDGPSSPHLSAFKSGNLLTSFRHLDAIAVIDVSTEKIAWSLTGMWRYQHEPSWLKNEHILLFDNQGIRDKSRVLEIDPFTQQMHWEYRGSDSTPFFSSTSGACHRLDNGNTLIIESNRGRAFEVSVTGDIVWEFLNPERAGKNKELVAVLFDVLRVNREVMP